ncbi:uncharacterized protein LOC131036681 isoform X4 [Cryptomeria japonica]|uniref:uncharacterized protein LOC131036681 isoform X4 n=1 Tax=Cryptomeria japonica TaxID=3369 RepID=UPI0025AB683D|nr:uncharacterized protein LOC131036681 isoform X4 [Cryptomeria japonica]
MWKDGRLVIFNRLDAETPVIKSVSNVNLFPCSPGKVFQVGCISAILLSTLEALADPKRLVKGWKSVSKSTMQLIGFERRPVIIAVSNWKPVQGETLAIMVSVPPAENFIDSINLSFRANFCKHSLVEVTFEEERFSAFSTSTCPNKWRTLIPLSPLDTTGTQKELDAVKVLVSNRTAKQYWDGSFRLPIHGEVTTEYGLKRCYNGVFASGYYHKGIDYGAPRGEPVWSPAAARVSLVGREEEGFALHGNCVGLDHGHGVTSILMHLDTILVENGMVVQAGDLLGTVGDTGLATGPHLHWGLYVHGKAVDQNQWLIEQSWLQ